MNDINKLIATIETTFKKQHKKKYEHIKEEEKNNGSAFASDADKKEQIRRWRYVAQYRNWF